MAKGGFFVGLINLAKSLSSLNETWASDEIIVHQLIRLKKNIQHTYLLLWYFNPVSNVCTAGSRLENRKGVLNWLIQGYEWRFQEFPCGAAPEGSSVVSKAQSTAEARVWSLAWCRGLRIPRCRSCGVSRGQSSDLIPGLGISTCGRCSQKKEMTSCN